MTNFPAADLLDLARTAHAALFDGTTNAWDPLGRLGEYLAAHLKPANHGRSVGQPWIGPDVFIGEGTVIEPGAMIKGPAWIGRNCEIRHGAYVRENVIVGDGAVLGNSCEFKNCLLFDEVQVPHFNYVGDSILGHRAHLGAGVILSNVRLDHAEVEVTLPNGTRIGTGLKKFGAILGDHAEVGCNSVLNPGSIIGRHGLIYPLSQWSGILPEHTLARSKPTLQMIPRHVR
jgi:UDP-N-acetylglucosamine diphosphorylase / glucose-1-phosphate thymidylyltransferase / UDP-N-acetylgalactosamine diphosphorylase / glucosamine-1-phosphate N-acetyltransferase / galactosamine-1-phosphate N-acetyltransferase